MPPNARCVASPSGARHGCSREATSWQHNTAGHRKQADWVRISHFGHPERGQVVRARRRVVREGCTYLIVELPDGRRERIPHSWTEDLIDGGSAVPALLFSPSSLRALVRLVREHGKPPSAETRHVISRDQDLEATACRDASCDDAALGRADAATSNARPRARRGAGP